MKLKLLPLIFLLLLGSCTITKRKYMSGYAVNWVNKTPKAADLNKQNTASISNNSSILTQAAIQRHIASLPIMNEAYLGTSNWMNSLRNGSKPLYADFNSKSKRTISFINPIDSSNNKKEICIQAKRSLRDGILSVAIPIAAVIVGVGFASLSAPAAAGALLSTGDILAFFFIFFAIVAGVILWTLAIINGIRALHKINKEPEEYTGRGKAITGMLFPLLLIIIPLLLWLINTIVNQY